MKTAFLSAAMIGVFGAATSLSALAAEPVVQRVIIVQATDVPAYEHELEVIQGIYKKLGEPVTIQAYRALYAGAEAGSVVVTIAVPNLTALGKMNEMTRTQPDVVAEMKKINALRKIVSDSLYEKLTP